VTSAPPARIVHSLGGKGFDCDAPIRRAGQPAILLDGPGKPAHPTTAVGVPTPWKRGGATLMCTSFPHHPSCSDSLPRVDLRRTAAVRGDGRRGPPAAAGRVRVLPFRWPGTHPAPRRTAGGGTAPDACLLDRRHLTVGRCAVEAKHRVPDVSDSR